MRDPFRQGAAYEVVLNQNPGLSDDSIVDLVEWVRFSY
jgi:hypothetical protein